MEADFCNRLRQLESRRRKPVFERLYNLPAGSHRSPVLGLLPRNLLIISVKPSYPVRHAIFTPQNDFHKVLLQVKLKADSKPNYIRKTKLSCPPVSLRTGCTTALRAEGTLHPVRGVPPHPVQGVPPHPERRVHCTPSGVYHRTPSGVYGTLQNQLQQ